MAKDILGGDKMTLYGHRESFKVVCKSSSATQVRQWLDDCPSSQEGSRPNSASQTSTGTLTTSRTWGQSLGKEVDYKVDEAGLARALVKSVTSDNEAHKPEVVESDMEHDVQQFAITATRDALSSYKMERDAAKYVKTSMDRRFGSCWQVLVGKEFGLRISYVPESYMFVVVDGKAVIIYKSH